MLYIFFYLEGITVLGGENSKRLDLGIYVKSVTEGGAAWRDGRLKAGKIIAFEHFYVPGRTGFTIVTRWFPVHLTIECHPPEFQGYWLDQTTNYSICLVDVLMSKLDG